MSFHSPTSITNDDSSEYANEMQNKIADFMEDSKYKHLLNDDDDANVDDDEDEGRELDIPDCLEDNAVDHIILGCSDIKSGMKKLEEMTGLSPSIVTTIHGGLGAKTVLVALDNNTFLELLGPNPGTTEGLSGDLQAISSGEIVPFHYAIRGHAEKVQEKVPAGLNWDVDKVTLVGSHSPHHYDDDEDMRTWDHIHLYGHGLGGVVPSYVHWRANKSHPTAALKKQGAKLKKVKVSAPSGHHVHNLLVGVNGVCVNTGAPSLTFEIQTPKGTITFSGSNPKGVTMPGFGDEGHQSYKGCN